MFAETRIVVLLTLSRGRVPVRLLAIEIRLVQRAVVVIHWYKNHSTHLRTTP